MAIEKNGEEDLRQAARELGRRGGIKRMSSQTPKQRRALAKLASDAAARKRTAAAAAKRKKALP